MTDDEAAACIQRQLEEMFPDDDPNDVENNIRRIADALEEIADTVREIAGTSA